MLYKLIHHSPVKSLILIGETGLITCLYHQLWKSNSTHKVYNHMLVLIHYRFLETTGADNWLLWRILHGNRFFKNVCICWCREVFWKERFIPHLWKESVVSGLCNRGKAVAQIKLSGGIYDFWYPVTWQARFFFYFISFVLLTSRWRKGRL